jgi:hypothetical protein
LHQRLPLASLSRFPEAFFSAGTAEALSLAVQPAAVALGLLRTFVKTKEQKRMNALFGMHGRSRRTFPLCILLVFRAHMHIVSFDLAVFAMRWSQFVDALPLRCPDLAAWHVTGQVGFRSLHLAPTLPLGM